MTKIKELLEQEEKQLNNIIKKTTQRLSKAPEGSLQLTSKKKNVIFLHHLSGMKGKGKYLSKKNTTLIKRLAQKAYDEKILSLAIKQQKQINKFLASYNENAIEEIYENEHAARKKMIDPVILPWEQKVQQWIEKPYESMGRFEENPLEIITDNGERVRSKSEKILADYFAKQGIVYKYEKSLQLSTGKVVCPDFTFLSPNTGKEIYWEHHGRMDDSGYVEKTIKKIAEYEKAGIYPGERLILTFESSTFSLSNDIVASLVEKYLKKSTYYSK